MSTSSSALAFAVAAAAVIGASGPSEATTLYRLRGDALLTGASDSTGVIVLQGEAKEERWLRAEALVFGGGGDGAEADALVMALKLRAPSGWGEARVGRMILSSGAGRPVHLDGASALLRAPWGTSVQAFGGLPVVPRFEGRRGDWAVGGRVAQALFDDAQLGVSWLHATDDREPTRSDVGVDLTLIPTEAIDLSGRATYDLLSSGVSEASVQAGVSLWRIRAEVFGRHQEASRLLPATSVFSVIGDVASRVGGLRLRCRLAPRLDASVTAGARERDGAVGAEISARSTLRLDPKGHGALSIEATRSGLPGSAWVGLRSTARVPLFEDWMVATELEIVRSAVDTGRGRLWPWGLLSVAWIPGPWSIAGAIEAGASPAKVYAVEGLLRVTYRWSSR